MKTLLFSIFFLTCGMAYSQDVKKEEPTQTKIQYCCVKNDYCGEKAKKCPNDQMPLIKTGLYYCSKCHNSKKKPGTCGRCDVILVKMEKKS